MWLNCHNQCLSHWYSNHQSSLECHFEEGMLLSQGLTFEVRLLPNELKKTPNVSTFGWDAVGMLDASAQLPNTTTFLLISPSPLSLSCWNCDKPTTYLCFIPLLTYLIMLQGCANFGNILDVISKVLSHWPFCLSNWKAYLPRSILFLLCLVSPSPSNSVLKGNIISQRTLFTLTTLGTLDRMYLHLYDSSFVIKVFIVDVL